MEMESTNNQDPESPISLSRFNLKPIPPRVQQTWFGKIRAFNTFTALEWAYLAISLIALIASMGITISRLTEEKPSESDFTFAILLLLTIVFCFHYVTHAIFTERWDELMVFVVSNIIVLVYCIVNYIKSEQTTTKLVRLCLICVLGPFLIVVGVLQSFRYCRSNNLIFNTVGGISTLQDSCGLFYICSSLLKFDLQLQLSMLILVMGKGVLNMSLTQKVILASGVPISVLFFLVGFMGLRHENRAVMIAFYLLGLFEPGYIIYKFYYTVTYEQDVDATYDATFVCGYFALVIWVLLIVSTVYFVIYHFGKGLKEKMFENRSQKQQSQSANTVSETLSPDETSTDQNT